ncbi:hypothetical protein BU23DRAFT_599191, partial [Bimuria novae-zelandiae CBS 107.79]
MPVKSRPGRLFLTEISIIYASRGPSASRRSKTSCIKLDTPGERQASNQRSRTIREGVAFSGRLRTTQINMTRVGEQRGMLRALAKNDEIYDPDVKRPKIRNNCSLQFYGSFTYDSKGPYHIYGTESAEAKRIAKQRLDKENQRNKEQRQRLVPQARAALQELGDAD